MLPPFTHEPRRICATCRRPESVCYCRFVTRIDTATRVVILQHPRERDVPINTARIASLCLPEAEVHVGVSFTDDAFLRKSERPVALLWPDADAIDVELAPPTAPITLVVVDGTWSQAKKVVRTSPVLRSLPRYAFRPDAPSDYRIRREPRDDYVSTIEALVHVLGVLERDRERFLPMLAPFRAMVDAQIEFARRRVGPRRALLRKRVRTARDDAALPELLRAREADLVCVIGESSAWPYDAAERSTLPDELIQWTACRPATGETFDSIVAPLRPLAPKAPFHTEIDEATITSGISRGELMDRWARFLRPSDVLCTWGHYAASLFDAAGGELPASRVDLRVAARTHSRARVGTMEDYRKRLGLPAAEPLARGRAGRRLADLCAIALTLSAGARGSSGGSPPSARE